MLDGATSNKDPIYIVDSSAAIVSALRGVLKEEKKVEHKIFCTNDNYQVNNHSCVELNRTQTVPAETIAGTYSMNMPQLELTDNKQHQVDLVPDGLDPGATCTEKSETLSSNFKPSELDSFGVDDASVGLNRYGEATSSEGSESSYFDLVPS